MVTTFVDVERGVIRLFVREVLIAGEIKLDIQEVDLFEIYLDCYLQAFFFEDFRDILPKSVWLGPERFLTTSIPTSL